MGNTNRQKTKIMEYLQEEGEQSFNDIYAFLNTKRIMKDGRRRSYSTTTPELANILGKNREFIKVKVERCQGLWDSQGHDLSFWELAQ